MYLNKFLQNGGILKKCMEQQLVTLSKASLTYKTTEIKAKVFDENANFQRKIFSGIQPTGQLHLGNYLGAVKKWTQLQNAREDVSFCIVDMHSITVAQNPAVLRENIFEMAATLIACGINPEQATIFVQSSVQEHAELCWILNCLCTMARLGHLPQYKEKCRTVKDVPLGIYVYPILQAADIMLYKATDVPVGEDQIQHIQLAQHLARSFNSKYGVTFPICQAILENEDGGRIRSLRNPNKKMSKSDLDTRATINIRDSPEVIVEKCKKAVTDFTSDVTYEPTTRPGVSNLVVIHSMITDTPIETVVEEAKTCDTARYKLRVAEAIVEHLKPIREKITEHLTSKSELITILEMGANKARRVAATNLAEVKQKLGLGIFPSMPQSVDVTEDDTDVPVRAKAEEPPKPKDSDVPVVPKQKIRTETRRTGQPQYRIKSTFKLDDDPTLTLPKLKKAQ